MEQIYRSFKDLFLLGLLIPPLAGLAVLVLRWMRRRKGPAEAWRTTTIDVLLVCAAIPAIGFTLVGGATLDSPRFQLVPFRDMTQLLLHSVSMEIAVAQISGNLLLFAGFGALLPMRWARFASWRVLILAGAGMGVLIETAQAFFGRISTIDDALLNAGGFLLAAALTHHWWRHGGSTDETGRAITLGAEESHHSA
jgi:hypothetical protein